jgi:hypothetical protein
VFGEFPGFPPNRDIYFSIELMLGASPMSNTPYRMSTLVLKELHMQLEKLLKKTYIHPSVSHLGCPNAFLEEK